MDEKQQRLMEEYVGNKFDEMLAEAMKIDFNYGGDFLKELMLTDLLFKAMELGRDALFKALKGEF